jgi:hypothetical protein
MHKLAALVPFLALVATGQTSSSTWDTVRMLPPGTDVRIAIDKSKPASGKLASVTESALVINQDSRPQTFNKAQIVSVEVKGKGHRVRNTFIAMGVGLAAGLGVGAAVGHNCNGFLCGPADVIVGGIVGIGGGAVGALVWPGGHWKKVYVR